jgi:hypothetical protein
LNGIAWRLCEAMNLPKESWRNWRQIHRTIELPALPPHLRGGTA